MRLLVVEAKSADRGGLAAQLRGSSHSVEHAPDAETALRRAAATPFEVVVVSTMAGSMPARELVKRLRAAERGAPAYVILATAEPTVTELESAFSAGIDDFVRKPVSRDELLVRIGGVHRLPVLWTGLRRRSDRRERTELH